MNALKIRKACDTIWFGFHKLYPLPDFDYLIICQTIELWSSNDNNVRFCGPARSGGKVYETWSSIEWWMSFESRDNYANQNRTE